MNASDLIDKLGGTSAVAQLCEVTTGAVAQWRTNGIPKSRLMFLRAVRPDVFDEPQTKERKNAARRRTDHPKGV